MKSSCIGSICAILSGSFLESMEGINGMDWTLKKHKKGAVAPFWLAKHIILSRFMLLVHVHNVLSDMRLYVDLKFHINKPLLPPFFQTTIFNAIHHKPVQLFLKSVCYLEIASEAGRADASRSFRNKLALR